MTAHERYRAVRTNTVVNAATNTLLGIVKVLFGVVGHSQALIADGLHSFSDLLTDVLVLLASKYGSQAADEDHPYGHQRIETVATVALAILLITVGAMIALHSLWHLFYETTATMPDKFVIAVAVISVVANEGLFRYTLHVAKRIKSDLLQANAWHSRSDAASSLIVLIGVTGAILGFPKLDEITAIIVGAMIIKMGIALGWRGLRELVDTGLDEQTLQQLQQLIAAVPGVISVHELRSRLMAGHVLIDVHVEVNSDISVSEGHYISEQVELTLRSQAEVSSIVVHIDVEDDTVEHRCLHLPSRQQVMHWLQAACGDLPGFNQHKKVLLHYINGKISVELFLDAQWLPRQMTQAHLQQQYANALSVHPEIATIQLWFALA